MSDAPRLTGLVVGDDPSAWRAIGFPVADDRLTVGGVTIRFAGSEGPRGILGWQLDPAVAGPVDGLASVEANPSTPTTAAPPTGRGYAVAALDHLVVATPDLERTTAALAGIGLRPRRTVDGVRGDTDVRYRFVLLGTCVLELIAPVAPAGTAPAHFGGLAFTAPDLDAFTEVTGPPRPAVQPGRHIVTVRTRDHDVSVPVAVLSPRPGQS